MNEKEEIKYERKTNEGNRKKERIKMKKENMKKKRMRGIERKKE